jgi:long-chain acyl-CoA synthetase
MKRAVLCVSNPEDYIDSLEDYSLMVVNPDSSPARLKYLLDKSDYSLLIDQTGEHVRQGSDYPNEATLWYTSGTTGDSKFYSFTKQQLDHVSQTIINDYKLTNNDRYLSVMPLYHGHGFAMYRAIKKVGGEVGFVRVPQLKSKINFDPTYISAIPDFLKILTKQDFKNLRFVRSASSALPTYLYHQLAESFNVPVIEAFGMTESCSHCFTNPLYGEQRIGTIGLPTGIDAKIDEGHLYIKGPSVFTSGWVDTGDLADQDSHGYYRILGRSVDRIDVRGYKLDPLSLENQLYEQLPELQECAIFGIDAVKCVYVGPYNEPVIADTLRSLGKQCRPALVKQLEKIPKNNADKISRKLLNNLY